MITPSTRDGIAIERDGAVVTVRIATPRGALDTPAKVALATALQAAADDVSVRAVVLTGSPGTFCVGQDLHAHAAALDADAAGAFDTVRDHYAPIVTALATMPKPVIAAIDGAAAGAGLAFALACDLRIASDAAKFATSFGAIGLSTDSGVAWTLPRVVGHARALEMLLDSRVLDAAEALRTGLVNEVCTRAKLAQLASERARDLATGPTIAYGAMKAAVAYGAGHGLVDTLEFEAALQVLAGTTSDHAAAVRSFLARQRPTFEGR